MSSIKRFAVGGAALSVFLLMGIGHVGAQSTNTNTGGTVSVTADGYSGSHTIPYGGSAQISWTSSGSTSCSLSATPAASYWSGTVASSGSQSTGSLSTSHTYFVTCGTSVGQVVINVGAPNSGGTTTPPPPPPPPAGDTTASTTCTGAGITYYLYFGKTDADTGGDVSRLQLFLKSNGLLSASAPLGFFGPLTQEAVQQYQASKGIVSSGTPDTTGYGAVGPRTLSSINGGCTSGTPIDTVVAGPTATTTQGFFSSSGRPKRATTRGAQGTLSLRKTTLKIDKQPSELTIDQGAPVGLIWKTVKAKSCTASGNWEGTKSAQGDEDILSGDSQLYTLTCTNDNGTTKSTLKLNARGSLPASATPYVSFLTDKTPPFQLPSAAVAIEGQYGSGVAIRELTSDSNGPVTLPPGPVTLYWQTRDAARCFAEGAWSGDVTPSEGKTAWITLPNVTSSGNYTIHCYSKYGRESSDTVKITIAGTPVPPRTLSGADRPFVDLKINTRPTVSGDSPRVFSDRFLSLSRVEDRIAYFSYNAKSVLPITSCVKSMTPIVSGAKWSGPVTLGAIINTGAIYGSGAVYDGKEHALTYGGTDRQLYGRAAYSSNDAFMYSNDGGITGAMLHGLPSGQYAFTVTCTNAAGPTSDTVITKVGEESLTITMKPDQSATSGTGPVKSTLNSVTADKVISVYAYYTIKGTAPLTCTKGGAWTGPLTLPAADSNGVITGKEKITPPTGVNTNKYSITCKNAGGEATQSITVTQRGTWWR